MNLKKVRDSLENGIIEWKKHALGRMLERGISRAEVREVLKSGEIIEDYPDDQPYPSSLILGKAADRPLHVVIAFREEYQKVFVITVYEPDPQIFADNFKTRRDE